jgi:predicted RNA-binding Zn-ribbon protein involved in translation (DUF1610 family)
MKRLVIKLPLKVGRIVLEGMSESGVVRWECTECGAQINTRSQSEKPSRCISCGK